MLVFRGCTIDVPNIMATEIEFGMECNKFIIISHVFCTTNTQHTFVSLQVTTGETL